MPTTPAQEHQEQCRELCRKSGAEEGWVVDEERNVRFFAGEELEKSELAADFPAEM